MADLINRDHAAQAIEAYLCSKCELNSEFCPVYNCPHLDCTEILKSVPTIEAELVKHGKWTDDTTDVVCSNCKARFEYEMLILIARGIKSEHVDGMTCRCPKCGSYNIYGGDDNV